MALKILIIYSFMKINLPLSTLILHWGYIINTNPIPAILAYDSAGKLMCLLMVWNKMQIPVICQLLKEPEEII